jgi:hypothetical protein
MHYMFPVEKARSAVAAIEEGLSGRSDGESLYALRGKSGEHHGTPLWQI